MVKSKNHKNQTGKLGNLIQDARIASDKSVEKCANAMGVTESEFESFESGEKAPSLPELEALGFYLDISIDHFLNREPISFDNQENRSIDQLDQLLLLRHRIISIMIRKARLENGITLEELARTSEINQESLAEYEQGTTPIPLPDLELISTALNLSLRELQDHNGPIGKWAIQKKAVEDFINLPLELQQFVSKPINLPYLELAQRLSEMSVDRLRGVAEGLLEITL